jgi:tetratricopeptide (TPR) repeat protein
MKKTLLVLLLILISQHGWSQDYKSEFLKYCETNDTINQLKVLEKWEAENPTDAELFTSYFNYHFMKAKKEILSMSKTQTSDVALGLVDSLGQNAGFIGSEMYYDLIEAEKGLKRIDQGIARYPNRLDMRFGKIYVLGELKNWEEFTSEIIKTIDAHAADENRWTWTDNEKHEITTKDFLLDIQNYQLTLYDSGEDRLLANMRRIANKVLAHYPDHIESLTNLSLTYLLTGEYDKGIEPLLRAEKLNPEDYIVLINIARTYRIKNETEKAIAYYEKVIQYGNEDAKQFAQKQLAEIKK